MVPTAERITTRVNKTTPVSMEAMVRHVLRTMERKSTAISSPCSTTEHASCAPDRNRNVNYRYDITYHSCDPSGNGPVWAKLPSAIRFDGDFTPYRMPVAQPASQGNG